MATKVTVLGEQPIEQEKKKIEFIWHIDTITGNKEVAILPPFEWKNIELVKVKSNDSGFDVMFAYNKGRQDGCIYLGHFNDGIV